ncbi:MAG TPA: hypothetical protein ENN69_04470 [Spirochaetia bacterium]|nr:hypothetical protein [Spirochaetia bacterium]
MRKKLDDHQLRKLISTAHRPARPSEDARSRILAMIQENTAPEPKAKKFPALFTPRTFLFSGLAAAAVVIVALALVIRPAGNPLTVVALHGGSLTRPGAVFAPGLSLQEKETIRTGPGEQVVLEKRETALLYLFSQSELTIASLAEGRPALHLELKAGSLYVNKLSPPNGADPFQVDVGGAYSFILKGTRVFFSIDNAGTVTVILYEGSVEVETRGGQLTPDLHTLKAKIKAVFLSDGTVITKGPAEWTTTEQDLDRTLSSLEPYTVLPIEEITFRADHGTGAAEESAGPRYLITRLGSVGSAGIASGSVNIYGLTTGNGKVYVNGNHAFAVIRDGGLQRVTGLPENAVLRAPPLPVVSTVLLSTATSVLVYRPADPGRMTEIKLPANGSIDHNFSPCEYGGTAVIPVLNAGYFRLDPRVGEPVLSLLFKELFPLGPAPAKDMLLVGSFYGGPAALLNTNGTPAFTIDLGGHGAVNPVAGDLLYFYLEADGKNRIIGLDRNGDRKRECALPWRLVSDFYYVHGRIYGVTSDGRLFVLDPASGNIKDLARLFTATLSTRELRYYALTVSDPNLLAVTENGSILIVDAAEARIREHIQTGGNEKFYSAPAVLGDSYYCVSTDGVVYRAVKTDR